MTSVLVISSRSALILLLPVVLRTDHAMTLQEWRGCPRQEITITFHNGIKKASLNRVAVSLPTSI
jgi:hypothetical protein